MSLVSKTDTIQFGVTVHTVFMMTELKTQFVKLVTKDVLDVMLKIITVPFVLKIEPESQPVTVLLV